MRNLLSIHLLALIATLSLSCGGIDSPSIPENVYVADTMVQILANIHIGEATLQQQGLHSGQLSYKSAFMQQLMKEKGIDTAMFNRSFDFYVGHPATFTTIYDGVIIEISKRQAASGAATTQPQRDSL